MQEAQNMEEILAMANQLFPGRSFGELSKEEQDAVFESYSGQRDMSGSLISSGADMMAGAGKTVGPSGLYVVNPWESLAGGLMQGVGYGMAGRANKQEKAGRKANADMVTRRDALDRSEADRRAREEEERRQQWLQTILQR